MNEQKEKLKLKLKQAEQELELFEKLELEKKIEKMKEQKEIELEKAKQLEHFKKTIEKFEFEKQPNNKKVLTSDLKIILCGHLSAVISILKAKNVHIDYQETLISIYNNLNTIKHKPNKLLQIHEKEVKKHE